MIELYNTIKINSSPEKVWSLLGDLARAPEYVPGIVTAKVEGMHRVCSDVYGNEIREQMSGYSPEKRTFFFEHQQVPLPVKISKGKFAIEAEGTHSLVSMEWLFEPLDPAQETELSSMLDGASKLTLENLRQRVEAL